MATEHVSTHLRTLLGGETITAPFPSCEGIGARIVFGIQESDFSHLSLPRTPYPFIIGPESISVLCTITTAVEMMRFIGLEDAWVEDKLAQGNRVGMVLFSAQSFDGGFILATWDNLLALVDRESPRCANKIRPHLDVLKQTTYPNLLDMIGFDVERPPAEVRARVATFADNSTPGDLGHVRAFFRHTLKCLPLFGGDGYAYNEAGKRGAREYVVMRRAIADLADARWITLLP